MGLNSPKQTYANCANSDTASVIAGISGVGEKPSSAGARTAWARRGGRSIGRVGKRERCQEFVAPRALHLCHGYRGLEGLFGRRGLRRVALEKKLTAADDEDTGR